MSPTRIYEDEHGRRLPSVTEVLAASYPKPEAFMRWLHQQGKAGVPYNGTRDMTALIGTIAHELVLARIGGPPPVPEGWPEWALRAARVPDHHSSGWIASHELKALQVEAPLVSHRLGFGGTPDWYGEVDGVLTVLDLKTSARRNPQHLAQVAAYSVLLEANGLKVERAGVLCLPRALRARPSWDVVERGGSLETHVAVWEAVFALYKAQLVAGF